MHGYNHVYTSHNARVIGISNNSEICGLTYEEQSEKIKAGLSVFSSYDLRTNCFVLPSYSFNKITLDVLRENNIEIISDGYLRKPYTWKQMKWILCQIIDYIKPQKEGIYTVCIHVITINEDNMTRFKKA